MYNAVNNLEAVYHKKMQYGDSLGGDTVSWLHSFNVTEFKRKNLMVTTVNYKCMMIYDMAKLNKITCMMISC